MGAHVFELTYTCAVTGETVSRLVSGWERARTLARDLAAASNRRAVITRRDAWTILLVDTHSTAVVKADRGLTTEAAMEWWSTWDYDRTGAVAVPWPESLPVPRRFRPVRNA